MNKTIKGRGAQINTDNPFDNLSASKDIFFELPKYEEEAQVKTSYIDVYPKSLLNKIESPDVPGEYSINPYQGCEHGCVYCYARNTHNYWGYSAGLDFESKILVKKDAPELLEKKLKSKQWKASPIMLSGNTDCYQPIERKLRITRRLLEILWRYRHPCSIITKNALILRDLDILEKMAEKNLVRACISMTTMNEDLRAKLEPRTATFKQRLKAVRELSKAGIPTSVNFAPIIPGLNDDEIFRLAEVVSHAGAYKMNGIIVRLNGKIDEIFTDWLNRYFPDKADKVLNKIRHCHGGDLHDSRFKTRMKGEGKIAKIIFDQLKLAQQKFFSGTKPADYNLQMHATFKTAQLDLFGNYN